MVPQRDSGGRKAPCGLAMTGQVLVAAPEWLLWRREPGRALPSAPVTEPRCTHRSMPTPSLHPYKHCCVSVCLNQSCPLRDNVQTQDSPGAMKLLGICLLLLLHPELSTGQEGDRRCTMDLGVSSARLRASSAPAVWHHLGAMLFSSRTYGLATKTRDLETVEWVLNHGSCHGNSGQDAGWPGG